MKTTGKNRKKAAELSAQLPILLVVSAVLFIVCSNVLGKETVSETVETELVLADNSDELQKEEVDKGENASKDGKVSMQPGQAAVSRSAPILTMETIYQERHCGSEVLSIRYDEIAVSGDGFEAVAQAVSEWNEEDIAQIKKLGDYAGDTHALSSDVNCNRMDNSVISFRQRWHEQDGSTYYRGINFDAASGKKLALADILTDKEGFDKKAIEIAVRKLSEIDKQSLGHAADVETEFTRGYVDLDNKWYLDAYGIVYIYSNFEDTTWNGYQPSHRGDMSEPGEDISEEDDESIAVISRLPGNITVTIPYEDVAEYMKPEYCGIQGAGVARFSVNETVRVNLSNQRNSEGVSYEESSGADLTAWDTVCIAAEETGTQEDRINKISIIVNDREEMFETEEWMQDTTYLLCQENGSTCLLFDTLFEEYGGGAYLYDITDGNIVKKEKVEWAGIMEPVNVNSLILSDITQILGTYFGHAVYTIDESTGKLVYPQLHYTDAEYGSRELTLVKELPVVMYGKETTLLPGTVILITAISDSGTAYFHELRFDGEGEFYYTIDDSARVCIDGLEESVYFEYLPYSG